ncbi:MAG: hypothetical protein VCD34_02575 [Planctomycetota bacterium]
MAAYLDQFESPKQGDFDFYIRRKVLKVFGGSFHVYDSKDNLVFFSSQKAFKLKEDIRVFSDESRSEEQLLIKARSIIDFGAAYDVVDSSTGEKLGAFRRKGFKSMLKDTWEMLDNDDQVTARLEEKSGCLALFARFAAPGLLPQTYQLEVGGQLAVTYIQRFNPLVFKLNVRLEQGSGEILDPRMALAAGILLTVIEGRQQ